MSNARLGWFVSLLLGGALLVTAVLVFRVCKVESRDISPTVRPEEAGKIYRQRMNATEKILQSGKLEVSHVRAR